MGRACAGARRGSRARQHRARSDRSGAASAVVCGADRRASGRTEDDLAFLRDRQDFTEPGAGRAAERRFRPDDRAAVPDRCVAARAVRALAAVPASRRSPSSRRRRSRKRAITSASAPAGSCVSATARRRVIGACRTALDALWRFTHELFAPRARSSRRLRRAASRPIPRRCARPGRAASRRC